MDNIGTPLKNWNVSINRGIITGFNDAFIITREQKDKIISEDPKSAEIIRPIVSPRVNMIHFCLLETFLVYYQLLHFFRQ